METRKQMKVAVYNTVTNLVLGGYRNYTTRAFGTHGIIIDIHLGLN